MNMKRIITPAVIALSAVLIFSGCKKDDPIDSETTSATDNSICENEFMRMLPEVNKIAIDEQGAHRLGPDAVQSCPNAWVPDSTQAYPRHMIIDYGTYPTNGCTDPTDGKIRYGKIRCTLSLPWDSVGSVITMSLDTFYVGQVQYEGTLTITRTGPNSFHKVVTNGKCTKSTANANWTIMFDSDHDITFTSGSTNSSQTPIVTITGTNHGTDRNGTEWTSNITSPITRDLSCSWIIGGTVELTPSGKSVRTINFGDGTTCDNKATITIDGNTFEISMQ